MTIPLSDEIRYWIQKLDEVARGYGLDYFPTLFEMVTYEQMNMLAAYDGFPVRYRHWKWGMEYERLSKSFTWGLHKIYELVVNTNPVYAYLLESNSLLDHKLVIGHVYAHADFFKNNLWFAHTDRRMLDEMANHAAKIARIAERHGHERVEQFIDRVLSLDNLIDPHGPFSERRAKPAEEEDAPPPEVRRIPARGYMDRYINPEEEIARQREELQRKTEALRKRIPPEPERDVLQFLIEHAPLERWQQSIVEMLRKEAYYFLPQRMTKIMNEGWASYWHSTIMTQHGCDDSDIIEFATVHSGVMATSKTQLNPYKLGLELYRDIEDRWNKGRFGLDYERCEDMARRESWDRQLGLGRQKIFEVRKIYNDLLFLDEFLTPEFAAEQKLFTFGFNKKHDAWEIQSREFRKVKDQLLTQLTNFGQPVIYVEDANYGNRGELLLWHKFDGQTLKPDYGRETLGNLQALWGRPVHLRTTDGKRELLWSHDGDKFQEKAA